MNKQEKKEYMKQWRLKNIIKVKAYQDKYNIDNSKQIKAKYKIYYRENIEKTEIPFIEENNKPLRMEVDIK